MSDYDFIVDIKKGKIKSKEELFFKYQNLIKMWYFKLKRSNIDMDYEEFLAEAYLAYESALKSVKIDNVNSDSWKFIGWFGFYLRNLKNYIVKCKYEQNLKEKLMSSFCSKDEDKDWIDLEDSKNNHNDINEKKIILNKLKTNLSSEESKITDSILSGDRKIVDVSKELNMSYRKVYNTVEKLKEMV